MTLLTFQRNKWG